MGSGVPILGAIVILAVMLLAGFAAGAVMGAAWAIRHAPRMEDEPSFLDRLDHERNTEE